MEGHVGIYTLSMHASPSYTIRPRGTSFFSQGRSYTRSSSSSRRHISIQGRWSRHNVLSGHPLAHSSVKYDFHSTHHTQFQSAAQCIAHAVHFYFLISSSMWYIASLALAPSSSSPSHNGPPRRLDWREVRVSRHRRGMVRKQCDNSNAIDNSALPRLGDQRTKSLAHRSPQ
jgi:hypothetical protein